jgi:shikimate dehydrogenase
MVQQNRITARTNLLGLIGHPVDHSLSPVFQNAALNALNLDYVYLAFDISTGDLMDAVRTLRTWRLKGINVTVPHKEKIIQWLDRLDDTALLLGAVNVVVVKDEELVGYNTDGIGFAKALDFNQINLNGKQVALLGAGGAARAVLSVLIERGVRKVIVFNRSFERSLQFQQWAKNSFATVIEIDNWESIINGQSSFLSQVDVLINATSLGLSQEIIEVPWNGIDSCELVIDVVYNREETPLVREARIKGKKAFDGKMMLLFQGAESFRFFTGFEAPIGVMEKALNEALR